MVIERKNNQVSVPMASLHPLDKALELMHFGFRGLTVEADAYLDTLGLSRVHHRILYVIARTQHLTVGDLAATLGISKQALHRPMTHLTEQGYVQLERDPERHRYKILSLTEAGQKVESQATQHERNAMQRALARVAQASQEDWHCIMADLADNLTA